MQSALVIVEMVILVKLQSQQDSRLKKLFHDFRPIQKNFQVIYVDEI